MFIKSISPLVDVCEHGFLSLPPSSTPPSRIFCCSHQVPCLLVGFFVAPIKFQTSQSDFFVAPTKLHTSQLDFQLLPPSSMPSSWVWKSWFHAHLSLYSLSFSLSCLLSIVGATLVMVTITFYSMYYARKHLW